MEKSNPSLIDAAISRYLEEHPIPEQMTDENDRRIAKERLALERVADDLKHGDCLVVVRFPQDSRAVSCHGVQWTTKEFRMDSTKLRATGSSVFNKYLSDEGQASAFYRTGRRPEDIRPSTLILDLTPRQEGDDLAAEIMKLSISPQVRDWWTAHERLGISKFLVSGHDDKCPEHARVALGCTRVPIGALKPPKSTERTAPTLDLDDILPEPSRMVMDYCPIRQRVAILRVLLSIEGKDLVVDSAPRAYTLACVAEALDCVHTVRDSVLAWMVADPNTDFIDINTEDALKIGWMIKSSECVRVSFRILVAEKALDILGGTNAQVYGRPRGTLTEEQENSVQHAAQTFAERIREQLATLLSDSVYDSLENLKEWEKLSQLRRLFVTNFLTTNEEQIDHQMPGFVKALKSSLLRYFQKIVRLALKTSAREMPSGEMDGNRRCYISRSDFIPIRDIFDQLQDDQRLLACCFWKHLKALISVQELLGEELGQDIGAFNEGIRNMSPVDYPGLLAYSEYVRFDAATFHWQLVDAISSLCDKWTSPELEVKVHRTKHLVLALSEDEFKFLPLWAGGLDDGTGGVFTTSIPDAELGPIGPGPSYNTGYTVATDASSVGSTADTPTVDYSITMTRGRSVRGERAASAE